MPWLYWVHLILSLGSWIANCHSRVGGNLVLIFWTPAFEGVTIEKLLVLIMTVKFSEKNQRTFEEYLTRYPTKQAAILPTLWLAQEQFGFISSEVMEYVASLLDVSPAHVYGVATFYTMFHQKPVGKYHLQVCRTLSCALMGSSTILEHLKKKTGLEEGEVSASGKFSLCTVECLASCGTGPMMMINEKYFENLTPEKIDEILAGLK